MDAGAFGARLNESSISYTLVPEHLTSEEELLGWAEQYQLDNRLPSGTLPGIAMAFKTGWQVIAPAEIVPLRLLLQEAFDLRAKTS